MNDTPDIPHYIKLPDYPDTRGILTVAEAERHIPFAIKRVFWITSIPPNTARAGHSHALCHQALIAVKGTVFVKTDNTLFVLTGTGIALYIPPGNYIELTYFSADAVLLVLCSHYYDEED